MTSRLNWLLATGLVLAAGCSSSSTPTPPADASTDTKTQDTGSSSEGGEEAATDAPMETGPCEVKDETGKGGCHVLTGTGAAATCVFFPTTDGCMGMSGAKDGPCPATCIYGCCAELQSEGGTDGGEAITKANCYYSAATGKKPEDQCSQNEYEGLPYEWLQMMVPTVN